MITTSGSSQTGLSFGGSLARRLEKLTLASDAQRKVVMLHWGYEHTDVPAPFQRKLAHRLVDAGASIVVGHHPHVAQGWETYRGVPIFYSLGNFNFWQLDTKTTEENRWGCMVRFEFDRGSDALEIGALVLLALEGEHVDVETVELNDPRHQDVWGQRIKRLRMVARDLSEGRFSLSMSPHVATPATPPPGA